MQYAGKVLRWLGITLAAVLLLLVAVFGLLQTQIGKGWLEREIARAASSPDFTVSMGGFGGVVPFGTCHRAKAGLWIDFPAGRNVENRPEARPTLSGTGGQSRRAETGRRRLRNRFSLSRGPNQLRGPQ